MENTKEKIIFLGTPEFASDILEELVKKGFSFSLVITAPGKPVGRKKIITPPPVKELAKKNNIEIIQPKRIKDSFQRIKEINPDLIITAAYGQLIPKEILDIPKRGSLNVHPSLLPKYRGSSPIQSAILNGEEETGISIILMDEKMDHGNIVSQLKYEIPPNSTTKILKKELSKKGAELLIETIPKWMEKKIKSVPQDDSQATYTKKINKEDGRINWQNEAKRIEKETRAFNPWPGAFTEAKMKKDSIQKKKIKILKSTIMEQTDICPSGLPGKTFLAPDDKIAVQAGKDFLIIEELQIEGKKPTTSQDFLKGNSDFIGTILG
jgi:methionyl-tRNA formyltransferase